MQEPDFFNLGLASEYDNHCTMDMEEHSRIPDGCNKEELNIFVDEIGRNNNSSSSLLEIEAPVTLSDEIEKAQKKNRKTPKTRWKKPPGMPKRPLSAYNYFFKHEREQLMDDTKKTCGIGFTDLAKQIAAKWKTLDEETKKSFQTEAMEDKKRYQKEVQIWKAKQAAGKAEIEKVSRIEPEDIFLRNSAPSSMLQKKPAPQPPLPMPAFHSSTSMPISLLRNATPSSMLQEKPATKAFLRPPDSSTSMPISLLGSSTSLKRGRASIDDFDVYGGWAGDTLSDLAPPPSTSFLRRSQSDSYVPPPTFSRRSQSDSFLLPILSDNYRVRSCEELAAESNSIGGNGYRPSDTPLAALVESLDPESMHFISGLNGG